MMLPACSPTSTGLLHSFAASSLQARAICVQTSAHPAATSIAPAATTTKPDSAITWLQVPHYIISCMVRTPPTSPPPPHTPPHPPYLRQAMMLPACSPTSTGLLHSFAASSLQARAAQHTAHITHHTAHEAHMCSWLRGKKGGDEATADKDPTVHIISHKQALLEYMYVRHGNKEIRSGQHSTDVAGAYGWSKQLLLV